MPLPWRPDLMTASFALLLSGSAITDASEFNIPLSYDYASFLGRTPGSDESAAASFFNPAAAAAGPGSELRYYWVAGGAGSHDDQWGVFSVLGPLGFGTVGHQSGRRDYRISWGASGGKLGVGYGWNRVPAAELATSSVLSLGTIQRPNPYLSLGVSAIAAIDLAERAAQVDLALRPLGDPGLTLFGSWELRDTDLGRSDFRWEAGFAIEPGAGLSLEGKWLDSGSFSLGLGLNLGIGGIRAINMSPRGPKISARSRQAYGFRVGYRDESPSDRLSAQGSRYLEMNLNGPVRYRSFRLLDSGSHALVELLDTLDDAAVDHRVGGVALNLSGIRVSRTLAWELREKLRELGGAGKYIVVYIDTASLLEYHLASVADHIVLDPAGSLMLLGEVGGRTYLRGTLDKLGIGIDELRFFTYKSALESTARYEMSAADREQRQSLVDGFLALSRDEICASRNVAPGKFDAWLNEEMILLPRAALDQGLVDELGRWHEMGKIIERLEGSSRQKMVPDELLDRRAPNRTWGPRPTIAIIYALGVCAMDEGIRGRELQRVVRQAARDDNVDAVVLRVDSPGGDPLASDLVAEALRECGEDKPVIVSQGNVAASGGYWLSMYGHEIVAAPNTITGSIGVIAGWVWNDGLGATLGMTTDHVQAGDHADLLFGLELPLVGMRLPERPLSADERTMAEATIRSLYDDFVGKVAEGRHLTRSEVDDVAQGRVWTGRDGRDRGLVDHIGGLALAIERARGAAGIPREAKLRLVELPPAPLLDPALLKPRLISADVRESAEWRYVKMLVGNPVSPLVLTPPDLVPDGG